MSKDEHGAFFLRTTEHASEAQDAAGGAALVMDATDFAAPSSVNFPEGDFGGVTAVVVACLTRLGEGGYARLTGEAEIEGLAMDAAEPGSDHHFQAAVATGEKVPGDAPGRRAGSLPGGVLRCASAGASWRCVREP